MIDPEFWLDEDITSLDDVYQLFYIGTWNFSDDYGVIEDSAKKLKAQVFPYRNIDVQPIIDKLKEIGKFLPFEANGKKWLYVKNFLKYQRVDKPSKNRNPKVPDYLVGEESESTQKPLIDEENISKENIREIISIPDWMNSKAWDAWVNYRKEIKKPLKPSTIRLQIKLLTENQKDHTQIIKNSITNGWTGLFPLSEQKGYSRRSSGYEKRVQEEEEERDRTQTKAENERSRFLSQQAKELATRFGIKN